MDILKIIIIGFIIIIVTGAVGFLLDNIKKK